MATRPVSVKLPTIDQILPPSVKAAILRQVALFLIGRIKRRTKAGVDVEGQPFKPYTMSYAIERHQAGWDATADLWLSGAMLNSMGILESTDKRALIGFSGTAPAVQFQRRAKARKNRKTGERITHTFGEVRHKEYTTREKVGGVWVTRKRGGVKMVANAIKAKAHNSGDGVPRRHFFGLSAEDKVEGAKLALKLIREYVARSSLNRAAGRR